MSSRHPTKIAVGRKLKEYNVLIQNEGRQVLNLKLVNLFGKEGDESWIFYYSIILGKLSADTITTSAENEEVVASDPTSVAKPPKTQERVLSSLCDPATSLPYNGGC